MDTQNLKIAYIGGGSKEWARVFMADCAFTPALCGEIALYDIDHAAAERNRAIGTRINALKETVSAWRYTVCPTLSDALVGADFVIISILPGTFEEMYSDVHAPEEYGVYQSVGDTAGPGGILRAMRTVPLYEEFARAIEQCCPNAWVLNLTNPMSICVKTLYDVFPAIKAFGCCHEVFHAQDFLCAVLKETLHIPRPTRSELYTDASGINHFTWITRARYGDVDILALLPQFMEQYAARGYNEARGEDPAEFSDNVFRSGNKVKMDLFARYGVLGAAGDRHLAEFMNPRFYMQSPAHVQGWGYHLTRVEFRKARQEERVRESIALANGTLPVSVERSDEELLPFIKALCGLGTVVSNVNMPNRGQMQGMPLGSIVETNCVFSHDTVQPVCTTPLPPAVQALVARACLNVEATYAGIRARDLDQLFAAFMDQPLLAPLSLRDGRTLFGTMVQNTRAYLEGYTTLM